MCFEDEEVITVGSSAYNLAGDVESRDNFMKNTILSTIFSGASKAGIGKSIVNAHLSGPATTYNRFFKWAESSGYNAQVGNLNSLVYVSNSISTEGFEFLVPPTLKEIDPPPETGPTTGPTHDRRIITSSISAANIYLIALEWIIKNMPGSRYKDFTASLQKIGSTVSGNILITFTTGGTVVFTPAYNLNNGMPFLYVRHEQRLRDSIVIIKTDWIRETPPAKVDFTGSFTSDLLKISLDTTVSTVTTYSDSSPTSNSSEVITNKVDFYKYKGNFFKTITVIATLVIKGRVTTIEQNEESFFEIQYTTTVSSSSTTSGGVTTTNPDGTVTTTPIVTATTTITKRTPRFIVYFLYKQFTKIITQEKWEPFLLKIYQKGSSSVGDALLFNSSAASQKFFPVIPLRRDNIMVDLANFPVQYGWNRKAVKKCFGSKKKYNNLIDSLADNPSLSDIDHAWVVFGVSLSTKQQDGQKYLFEFFKNLADTASESPNGYKSPSVYADAWANFIAAVQRSTNDEDEGINRPIPPVSQDYTITVNSSEGVQNWLYNTIITAKGGGEVFGSGYHAKSGNKVGNCWVYAKSTIVVYVPQAANDGGPEGGSTIFTFPPSTTTVIAFGKQLTSNTWVEYEFFDLAHINNVYQGIGIATLGMTVIAKPEENSGFIIPLHEGVFSDLNLIRRTQLSLECSFIVVNYYDKQYIPWYASGIFQIILVIVIIVVAVYTGYISSEAIGLLGANGAVGASLGFTGLAATIAGAIANAVAAAIVSSMITKVAISALGEDVGRIIGVIASMVAINLMSSSGPFNLADSWAQMTKADNLIKLTMSGVNGYGSYLQGQAMEVNAETQALMLESAEASKEINRLTRELMGDSGIDPATITNAIRYATENPSQFLSRTTMTGTEIAEASISLVEDFPAPQLTLPYLD